MANKIVDHLDVVGAPPVGAAQLNVLNLTPGFNGFGKDKLQDETRNI